MRRRRRVRRTLRRTVALAAVLLTAGPAGAAVMGGTLATAPASHSLLGVGALAVFSVIVGRHRSRNSTRKQPSR